MILKIFGFGKSTDKNSAAPELPAALVQNEIDKDFVPTQGNFMRTLEYPEFDLDGNVTGKTWMEAALDEGTQKWVLWNKSVSKTDDLLTNKKTDMVTSRVLMKAISFVEAYDQMTTFERAKAAMDIPVLPTQTPAKLSVDYYKQFAYREGLIMSKSGRLYPYDEQNLQASNYFDLDDIKNSETFLKRLRSEQFIAEPIEQPTTDWEASYQKVKATTDERLNALLARHGQNKEDFSLALQIVGQEKPEVLYAFIKRGFNPKIFEADSTQHFMLMKAALERIEIGPLFMLSEAGVSFYAQHNDETPVEIALQNRRYSHLNVMLARDGETLANYTDESGHTSFVSAIQLQDRQAFRMFYLAGIDFEKTDAKGWYMIHHAFKHSFVPAINVWLAEELPIDVSIKGTHYTGVSIAKNNQDQTLIEYAVEHGANPNAPAFIEASPVDEKQTGKEKEFDLDIFYSDAPNEEILELARNYAHHGGDLNTLNRKGQHVLEICWQKKNTKPELNRRNLIASLSELGADPSEQLEDGSTVLTRLAAAANFDADFFKTLAPLALNQNASDADGNTVMHHMLLNKNQAVSHTNNLLLVIKELPDLDLNAPNNNGLSSFALAILTSKSRALKSIIAQKDGKVDWGGSTSKGWSLLDLAFTQAAKTEASTVPTATQGVSAQTRDAVLEAINQTTDKEGLTSLFNRPRPDGATLLAHLQQNNPELIPAFIK